VEKEFIDLDISVVTFNSMKWIDSFIESIINQNYSCSSMNLLFTDNGSNDETVNLLLEYKEKVGYKFKTFIVRTQSNMGFGHGHNNNIFKSCAEFILVTNLDLTFEVNSICKIVDFALKDDISVASWEFRQKPFEHPKDYNPVSLETNWSSSACILFRRKMFEEVGGYEKKIFMYGEDVEISYRLRDAGYILKYIPNAVCWHYTYDHANQVKPLQFLGSTLANIYLRLRYGSFRDIVKGFSMYFAVFFLPEKFSMQRFGLLKNFFLLILNIPYFFTSRKKSNKVFNFYFWDYELRRDGAFYSYKQEASQADFLVSIIIRTYNNRLDFLKEALQSICNQTYRNIEVIVVEDGSSYAEAFIRNICASNIKNIIYRSISKSGRCRAGNVGLSLATGQFLMFLDDDDLLYPDHLEVLAGELKSDNNIAAVYTSAFEVLTDICSIQPLEYIELEKNVIYRQQFSRSLMWKSNYIPIQAILFKRELYESYGGFDEELEMLEDWNLWTRYTLENEFKFIDKTTSLYRVPANSLTERQTKLDNYYKQAVEKQREMVFCTTPASVVEYADEITKQTAVLVLTKELCKAYFKKYKRLEKVYFFMRKVYYKWKNSK
jgi:GT2 family glycosyltransferase